MLLNKVVLEYIPKYGQRLADEVRKWGQWIKEEAEKEFAEFYPKDPDGATPIAYLWARMIRCEGPGCGAEVPLIRSLWLAKKPKRSVALQLVPNPEEGRVDFRIILKTKDGWVDQADATRKIANPRFDGTVKRGSATCPCCGFTTPVARVRESLSKQRGGAHNSRLLCVVVSTTDGKGCVYRKTETHDLADADMARMEIERLSDNHEDSLSAVPTEPLPPNGTLGFRVQLYGMVEWKDLFTPRQQVALVSFAALIRKAHEKVIQIEGQEFANVLASVLSMALAKLANYLSTLCIWRTARSCVRNAFAQQTLPMTWDFGEMNPFAGSAGDWEEACRFLALFVEQISDSHLHTGIVDCASATALPLPDDSTLGFITDPPYYDSVPYADLSDYFYVWHKRVLSPLNLGLFEDTLTPKSDECIVDAVSGKDAAHFETTVQLAMVEGRRVLCPNGIAVIVFAHKSTSGWETLLQAMIDAGWIITGSWPIDTERPGRTRANDSAALASSIHLVCRPRENSDGSIHINAIGDWRAILEELPRRIHEWMPRLVKEGVVGADAIFACLGPTLEIFSRYSRVEKASGETVGLKEYLEHVWAAVAREALSTVLDDADSSTLDPDARLTVIWLWTLGGGQENDAAISKDRTTRGKRDTPNAKPISGFLLEYDAARKIAQGLGARLEELAQVVEVKGDKARLLPVFERTRYLFGKTQPQSTGTRKSARKAARRQQMSLFAELEEAETTQSWDKIGPPKGATTTLDRIHQAMLLFGTGRSEALKRFLVEEGIGRQVQFWKLAQSLSALYPGGSEEKRWVDGVLARKKGLGFG